MSENESNGEAWVATDDPTEGDLPTTEFIGTPKDISQSQDPQEGDGSDIANDDPADSAEPVTEEDK